MGSDIKVADDLIRAKWKIRQPSSTSQAERRDAARKKCEAAGRAEVEIWNRVPNVPFEFEFHSARLLRLENVETDTVVNNATGERHHEAKGVGVAELHYTVSGDEKSTDGSGKISRFADQADVNRTDIVEV